MIIDILNYQPFYYLVGIRMFHILLIVPTWYLLKEALKQIKQGDNI